jgi:FMN phosphatase YigB (HAD superfamily)
MTKAVLFDLGDTVFKLNPMADVTEEFTAVCLREGLEDAETEAIRIIESLRERVMAGYARGDHLEESPAALVLPFIGSDARARRLAERLDGLVGARDIARWERADGREALFDGLRSRGLKIAFVSNTMTPPALMNSRLMEFELHEYPHASVFSVEHGVRKPNPAIYQIALRALGVEPGEALFVGDRVREDVRGPQGIGMRGVLTHEFRQEDPADSSPLAVVGHLSEVARLIE